MWSSGREKPHISPCDLPGRTFLFHQRLLIPQVLMSKWGSRPLNSQSNRGQFLVFLPCNPPPTSTPPHCEKTRLISGSVVTMHVLGLSLSPRWKWEQASRRQLKSVSGTLMTKANCKKGEQNILKYMLIHVKHREGADRSLPLALIIAEGAEKKQHAPGGISASPSHTHKSRDSQTFRSGLHLNFQIGSSPSKVRQIY